MARVLVVASGFVVANAGSCSADDQAALADPQVVGDKQNKCGTKNLGLSGIDHDGFVSCVQSELGISASCSECYYPVAKYGFDNCKAACLLGWCKSGCLSCTQPAQDTLAGCAGFAPAAASPCDDEVNAVDTCSIYDMATADTCGEVQLDCQYVDQAKAYRSSIKDGHCADAGYSVSAGTYPLHNLPVIGDITISLFKQALGSVATGSCSADDQAALADPNVVGTKQNECGTKNLGLTGIDHDGFVSCVQSELGISASCSECYYPVAKYGFDNCKAACLLGWCKSGCLSCTQPAQDTLAGCAGFAPAAASPCDDIQV